MRLKLNLNEGSRHLMVIIGLWQPAFQDLFENADEGNNEVLVRISIECHEMKKWAQSSTHYRRVGIRVPRGKQRASVKRKKVISCGICGAP